MEKEIYLSIIVAVHGVERFIEKCLLSILNQKVPFNYEIICVNDVPNDQSPQIIEKIKKKFPSILKSIIVNNRDLSQTRNDGLAIAKGKYVLFVDGDDFVQDNYLSEIYKLTQKYKSDIFTFSFYKQISENTFIKNKSSFIFAKGLFNRKAALFFLQSDIFMKSYVWKQIYLRDFLIKNGIKFLSTKKCLEDLNFNLIAFSLSQKNIYFSRKRLYVYNVIPHPSILKNINILEFIDRTLNSIANYKFFCIQHGLVFTYYWGGIKRIIKKYVNGCSILTDKTKKGLIKYYFENITLLKKTNVYKNSPWEDLNPWKLGDKNLYFNKFQKHYDEAKLIMEREK